MAKQAPSSQGGAKEYKVGNKRPPKERQFGQPNGNPRNTTGCWKKEDTARYKLEQMLKLDADEIKKIALNEGAPLFERRIAKSLLNENEWKITESMINQVYGTPKQTVDHEVANPLPLIDLTGMEEAQDKARAKASKPKATKKTTKTAKTTKKSTKTAKKTTKTTRKTAKKAEKATEAPQKDESVKNG